MQKANNWMGFWKGKGFVNQIFIHKQVVEKIKKKQVYSTYGARVCFLEMHLSLALSMDCVVQKAYTKKLHVVNQHRERYDVCCSVKYSVPIVF